MPASGTVQIALIDYGAGNLSSVRKGFAAAGAGVFTPATPAGLMNAGAIVVPGIGHFKTTAALTADWRRAITNLVQEGVPLLGICVGLQWLFEGSDEAPDIPGLNAIRGRCTRLPSGQKVPHVGWNTLEVLRSSRLLHGVADRSFAYFTHSYAAPVTGECAVTTTHGVPFASVVERSNVYGVQFHPEKSGPAGIRLLKNFVAIAGGEPGS
jgi:glutamine amidotransferase